MNSDSTARRVIYRGRVQGVGFRETTRQIARGFAVTGFVRNLQDGTVELVAQGAADEVERFLNQVARQFGPNITGINELPVTEQVVEQEFRVR